MSCYEKFGWSPYQVDEILDRGFEAMRLAVYFEEVAAHEYQQMKKYQDNSPSTSNDEVIEFIIPDEPADVEIPDDDFIEEL